MRSPLGYAALVYVLATLIASEATAQTAPASPPGPSGPAMPSQGQTPPPPNGTAPPDYQAPAVPPGYVLMPVQPQPGSPAQPGYGPAAPPGYSPPLEMKYRDGDPIPPGYHLEKKPRMGAVVSGIAIGGVAYGIGLLVAISDDFDNQKGWLILPVVGPWITLGQRDNTCRIVDDSFDSDVSDCVSNTFTPVMLVIDGLMQVAGGTLLLIGNVAQRTWLVRDGARASISIAPGRVGENGHGGVLSGTF